MTQLNKRYLEDLNYLQETMTPMNAKHFLGINTVLREFRDLDGHDELLSDVYDSIGYPIFAPDDQELIDAVDGPLIRLLFQKDFLDCFRRGFTYEGAFYELSYNYEELILLIAAYNALDLGNEPTEERITKAKEIMTEMIPLLNEFLPGWVKLHCKMYDFLD